MTFSGTAAAINAALGAGLTYNPNANFNGSDSIAVLTTDNGQTGTGGTLQDNDSVTITVVSINDAPAGTDKAVTINEDASYVFAIGDFGFTDPNDTPANALQAVKITTLPGAGSLTDNGVAVTAGQLVSAADIAGGLPGQSTRRRQSHFALRDRQHPASRSRGPARPAQIRLSAPNLGHLPFPQASPALPAPFRRWHFVPGSLT
jgi:hypothetical protein